MFAQVCKGKVVFSEISHRITTEDRKCKVCKW